MRCINIHVIQPEVRFPPLLAQTSMNNKYALHTHSRFTFMDKFSFTQLSRAIFPCTGTSSSELVVSSELCRIGILHDLVCLLHSFPTQLLKALSSANLISSTIFHIRNYKFFFKLIICNN